MVAPMIPILWVIGLSFLGAIPSGIRSVSSRPDRTLARRVFTGCALGVVVSLWIFSGTWGFLAAFGAMAVVSQNEYYAMARKNGVHPTWKLGLLGSVGMHAAACSNNAVLRDALFPLTGTITILYLLLRREPSTPPTTMNDISTTFMGIYYFGYMPSFWIRLRCLGPAFAPASMVAALVPDGSRAAAAAAAWPSCRAFLGWLAASGANIFTGGAVVQWWTMISIVAADVGAYFAGKRFGRTQLIAISPGKTVEGLVGGCAAAMGVAALGARLMQWPRPLASGAAYGLMCAVMALIGDLTVSLLKRSAGVKDTGRLLPGHGGLLDRLDSFLLVPAPAFFFVRSLLPLLRAH